MKKFKLGPVLFPLLVVTLIMGAVFVAKASEPPADSDADGLPDAWETQYFGGLGYGATDDPGSVGRTLLNSYTNSLSPWPAPTVASGLRAWYRADLGVTKDVDNKVSQWTDLSGHGFHVVQTAESSQQPLWVTSAMNGKPALSFGATVHDNLKTAGPVNLIGGGDDLTVVMVVKPAAETNTDAVILDQNRDGSYGPRVRTWHNQFRLSYVDAGVGGRESPGANLTAGQVQIYTVVKSGTSSLDYLNGTAQLTGTSGTGLSQTTDYLVIGNQIAPHYAYTGQVAEILVYNRALTTTERQSVEAALTTAYVNPDSDADGLADAWENQYFGGLGYGATDDPGSVGRTLLNSYTNSLSPWPAATVASGLRAWYRADLGVAKDVDNKVSQWTDLSGHGFHVVQTAEPSRQPLWVSSALNGKPAVQFGASGNDNLMTNGPVNLLGSGTDTTVIVVVKPDSSQNYTGAILDHESDSQGGVVLEQDQSQTNHFRFKYVDGAPAGHASPGVNFAPGQVQVYSVVKTATSVTDYLNGATQMTGSSGTGMFAVSATLALGNRVYPYYAFKGQIAEVLVYNRALTTTERQNVEAALTTAYVNPDSDADGLADTWENQYFGGLGYGATDDPGSVGRTLLNSYTNSLSPWPAPTVTSGLRAWYRADLGVAKDVDNKVSQWTDLSGHGFHVVQTATPSRQPLWVGAVFNGKPAIAFGGSSNDNLMTTGPVNLLGGGSDTTVIVVVKPEATQSYNGTILDHDRDNLGGQALDQPGDTTSHFRLTYTDGTPTARESLGVNLTAGQVQVYSVVKTATAATDYLNGTVQQASGAGTGMYPVTATLAVGNRVYPYYAFKGQIAEVLVYNRALTTTERQSVEAALTTAYVNLDSDADGLPDAWETQYFGGLGYGATDDPGSVGRTLLNSYTNSLSPWPAATVASGLRAWYRADLGVAKDVDNKVSQWTDLSGHGFHVVQTATPSRQPLWVSSALNGKPAVTFGLSSNDNLTSTGPADVFGGAGDLTVIAVLKPEAEQNYQGTVFAWGDDGNLPYGLIMETTNQYEVHFADGNGSEFRTPGVNAPAGQVQVLSMVKQGTSATGYRNGTAQGTGSAPATLWGGSAPVVMGNHHSPFYAFKGQIAEVLVYNRALTTTERQNAETVLTNRYINADSDGDGLLDAWELQYFGNLLQGGADDPDGDGLTNLQEKNAGTNPTLRDTDGDGIPDGLEVSIGTNPATADAGAVINAIGGVRLHLDADAGIVADGTNHVSVWQDQGGQGNHASQSTSGSQALAVPNVVNGHGVIRFNGTGAWYQLPNFMNGATQGEIMAVLKAGVVPSDRSRIAWSFGNTTGNAFPAGTLLFEDFGSTTQWGLGTPQADVGSFVVMDASSKSNEWIARLNGSQIFSSSTNTVSFRSNPMIGRTPQFSDNYFFNGDMAEMVVFDHILTAPQREAVGIYLARRYALSTIAAPTAPTALRTTTVGSNRIGLAWTGGASVGAGAVFSVERRTGSGAYVQVGEVTDAHTYTDATVSAGVTYTYRVSARNYQGSSSPGDELAVTAAGSALPLNGMRLWLDAESLAAGSDQVLLWSDRSGLGNNATQSNPSQIPHRVAGVLNGFPAVRFKGSGSENLALPNFMSSATAGELFMVVKAASSAVNGADNYSWSFGPAGGGGYPNSSGHLLESFGSTGIVDSGRPTVALDSFRVYNVSAAAGLWANRLDGAVNFQTQTNTVGFNTGPQISRTAFSQFAGDISEIIAYDHVLTAVERETVGRYLNRKYLLDAGIAPAAPTAFDAAAISASQVALSWRTTLGDKSVIYSVERRSAGGEFSLVAEVPDALSYIDTGLVAGTAYEYRLRARYYGGDFSEYATSVTAATTTGLADMPLAATRLWLKADAGMLGEHRVTYWPDQSGHGYDGSQSNANSAPTRTGNALNGLPVVRFNSATADNLNLPNFMSGATQGDLFMVVKAASDVNGGPDNYAWVFGPDNSNYPNSSRHVVEGFGTSTAIDTGQAAVSLADYHLYNVSAATSAWSSRFDGIVHYQTGATTVAFNTSPHISRTSFSKFAGDIAEVIAYDRTLTAAERRTVEAYLAFKYALPGLTRYSPFLDDPSGDSDGDGLSNALEVYYGTNPIVADTDGDGVSDGLEVQLGTNPLVSNLYDPPDASGLTLLEKQALGIAPGTTIAPDTNDSLKLRIYRPRN